MSKSKASTSLFKSEDFVISVFSFGLGLLIFTFLVVVERLELSDIASHYNQSRSGTTSPEKPALPKQVASR